MAVLNDLGLILNISLMYASPLIFTSLGGVVSENSGVINIGLEGMMTMGAFVGAAVGYFTKNPWLAFLAAGISGGIIALFHAIACVSLVADQVISGVAINFLGPGLALFLSRIFFDGATHTQPIDLNHKIPRPFNGVFAKGSFLDALFNHYATVYVAFLLVLLIWFVLYKTRLGLRIRAVGEHPRAADTLGVNVFKVRYLAVITSGVFAGFGGAAMSLAIVSNFRASLIAGQGFIALAAMIFGKWTPQGSLAACLFFGFAQGLVVYLGRTEIPVSSQILAMIPYVITILVLMGFVGGVSGPAANGIPYEKHEN